MFQCDEELFSAEEGPGSQSRGGTASSSDSGVEMPDRRPRQGRQGRISECQVDPEHQLIRTQLPDRVSRYQINNLTTY